MIALDSMLYNRKEPSEKKAARLNPKVPNLNLIPRHLFPGDYKGKDDTDRSSSADSSEFEEIIEEL